MLVSSFPAFHVIGSEDFYLGARTYNFMRQYGAVNAAMSRRLSANALRQAPLSVAPAPRPARFLFQGPPGGRGHPSAAAAVGAAEADSSAPDDEGFEEEDTSNDVVADDEPGADDGHSSSTESIPDLE